MTITVEKPFSVRLREHTTEVHEAAETSSFMSDLLGGRLDTEAYVALLGQYRYIYEALESAARKFADDPAFGPFHDVNLERAEAIRADLDELGAGEQPILDSTGAYVVRLRSLPGAPELIGHHYTRYLGDLSGGQAIGTLVKRHYGVQALRMWDFPGIEKLKPYKDAYRAELDRLTNFADTTRVEAETVRAFDFNRDVFAELAARRG